MKLLLWIAAIVLFLCLAGGAFYWGSTPGFWVGLAGAALSGFSPFLGRTLKVLGSLKGLRPFTPLSRNQPYQKMQARKKKERGN